MRQFSPLCLIILWVLYNVVLGVGDLGSQLSSRDDYIYQLKLENAMLVKVNKELKAAIELLRSQSFIAPVKEDVADGSYIMHTCMWLIICLFSYNS